MLRKGSLNKESIATAADAMCMVGAIETVHSIAARRNARLIARSLGARECCRTLQGVEQRHSGVADADRHRQTSR